MVPRVWPHQQKAPKCPACGDSMILQSYDNYGYRALFVCGTLLTKVAIHTKYKKDHPEEFKE